MKRAASSIAVVAATLVFLTGLFAFQPFARMSDGLDRAFGALPAWTQVANMFRDPTTQEVSRGDSPVESFRLLSESWTAHPGARRVVLMGNSQSLMTSLAPGEAPPTGPEKTYADHIADRYREAGSHKLFYRLSSGAMSYQEMLWYAMYVSGRADLKPDVLLVQLNYQNFVNGGIRGGMLALLSDTDFRHKVEAIVERHGADADAFAEALQTFDQSQHSSGPATTSAGQTFGYRIETEFRRQLDRIPGFNRRDAIAASFVLLMYRCRVYFLHLGSARARSLSGSRIAASRAALEDLADVCGRAGIWLILFEAPTNPAVPLYAKPEDDRQYHEFTQSVASRFGLKILDFEHSIPAGQWGMSLNVPDPLHLGREGHRRLADLLSAALDRDGV
jgi:hypothetical protein